MTAHVCVAIPPAPDPQVLTLPGGVRMEHLDLASVVQPALTPLVPIFDVIDTVLAVFKAIEAIPDTIGPPPDPSKLAAVMPELAEKVQNLLRLVPQLSLPFTVVGLLDLILATLRDTRDLLAHLHERTLPLHEAERRAQELGDAQLQALAACGLDRVAQEAANAGKKLAALGSLIGLLNLFLGMVGGPEVPDLSSISGKPLDEAVQAIDGLVDVFETVRRAIPVPA